MKMLQTIFNLAFRIRNLIPAKGAPISDALLLIYSLLLGSAVSAGILKLLLMTDLSPALFDKSAKSHLILILVCGLILVWGFLIRGFAGLALTLSTTITLFLLPLVAIWNHHIFVPGMTFGGLLPWSDANSYYLDASALLDGFPIGWSARRPLFVGLLASLLKLTGSNLSACMVILVVFNALGTFFLAREVSQTHSPLSGAIVTVLSFLYYGHVGGGGNVTTLTENLGLALGMTSIAILYAAIRNLSKPMMLAGIFFLTLALCARAGTFFVLPCIILSSGLIFRDDQRFNRRISLLSTASSLSGFIANFILTRLISEHRDQVPFSNFSYTLYGLVVGGKGWAQVMTDYPLAREGADMYQLAFAHFKEHPFDLLAGIYKMWAEFMPGHHYHAYQFVGITGFYTITQYIQPATYILLLGGLVWCIANRRTNHAKLLLFITFGYFISIPFAPSIDAGLRVYAATIGLLFILPAIGAAWVAVFFKRYLHPIRRQKLPLVDEPTTSDFARSLTTIQLFAALTMVILATIAPVIIKSTGSVPPLRSMKCQAGQEQIHFRYNPGSSIMIVDNGVASRKSRLPYIDLKDIQNEAAQMQFSGDPGAFSNNRTVLTTHNLTDRSALWVTMPTRFVPLSNSLISACGRWSDDKVARSWGLFHVEEAVSYGSIP